MLRYLFLHFYIKHINIMNDPNLHCHRPQDNLSYSIIQTLNCNQEFVDQSDKTINFLTQNIFGNSLNSQKQTYKYQVANQQEHCCFTKKQDNIFEKSKNSSQQSQIMLLQDSQFWQLEKQSSNNQKQQQESRPLEHYNNQNCQNAHQDQNKQFLSNSLKDQQNQSFLKLNAQPVEICNQPIQLNRFDFIKKLQNKLQRLHKRIKIKRNVSASFQQYKQNVQNDYQQFSVDQSLNLNLNSSVLTSNDFFQSKFLDINHLTDSFYKNKTHQKRQIQVQTEIQNDVHRDTIQLMQIPLELMMPKIQDKSLSIHAQNKSEKSEFQEIIKNQNSHFFGQNDQIHNIMNGIYQKVSLQSYSKNLKYDHPLKGSVINNSIASDSSSYKRRKNSDIALSSLVYSSGIAESELGLIHKNKKNHNFQKFDELQNQSFLSNNQNQNSISFHRKMKEQRGNLQVEEGDQTISNLFTKITQNQTDQIQRRFSQLLQQNADLKQKIKEATAQIQFLSQKNINFWDQKQSIESQYIRVKHQCQYYLQQIQYIKEDFSQKMAITKIQTKNHYQQIINQLEQQQSQYAQRIIGLQQLLEQKTLSQKNIQQRLTQKFIQIGQLHKQIEEKQVEISSLQEKQKDLTIIYTNKEVGLKEAILKLEEQNNQLVNILKSYKYRQQQEGIFVLCAQAQQIKETIQNKEAIHHEELQEIQIKYGKVIQKYQNQIQKLKQKVQKVKQNKSTSIQYDLNRSSSLIHQDDSSKLKNRQSIRSTRLTTMSTFNDTVQCSSYQYNNSQNNGELIQESGVDISIEKQLKLQQKNKQTFYYLRQLKMKQIQSFQHNNVESEQKKHFTNENSSCVNQLQSILPEQKCKLKKFFQNASDQVQLELFLTKLINQNEYLEDLIERQREQKFKLTKQLKIFEVASFKYIQQLQAKQEALLKDEELFQKITFELERQYTINTKLKKKIMEMTEKASTPQNFQQQTISLSKDEYKKMVKQSKSLKKYVRILQKQVSDINLLQQCQNHKNIVQSLQGFISQNLKQFSQIKNKHSSSLWSQQKQAEVKLFNKKMERNQIVSNTIQFETQNVQFFDIFSKKVVKLINNGTLTLDKLIQYSISPQKMTNQMAKKLNHIKTQISVKVIEFAIQQIKSNKKLPQIRPDKILLSRFFISKNNIVNVEMMVKKQIESTTKQFQNQKQLIYAAPQVLLGIGQTQQAYAWTVGLIIDQIFHKRPYYKKIQQIISHKENYMFQKERIVDIKQIVQSMVKKSNKNRLCLKQAQSKMISAQSKMKQLKID